LARHWWLFLIGQFQMFSRKETRRKEEKRRRKRGWHAAFRINLKRLANAGKGKGVGGGEERKKRKKRGGRP